MHDQPSDTGRARAGVSALDIDDAAPFDVSPGMQYLPMFRAQFSPKENYLLAIGNDPASKIFEGLLLNPGAPASVRRPAILKHDEPIRSAAFSADESSVLTGSSDDRAKI